MVAVNTKTRKKRAAYTVFNTVYRTMVQKRPKLVIALINELFGTDYSVDIDSQQLRNEQLTIGKKLITDSIFRISDRLYHLECQSTPDGTMAIRMFEYDALIALDGVRIKENNKVRFPFSGVLYLRHNSNTGDELKLDVEFPDGQAITYKVPVLKAKDYTLDALFDKGLLLILPFYIMRFENALNKIEYDKEKNRKMLEDLQDICLRLEALLGKDEQGAVFVDLLKWITTVSDYLLETQPKLRKEVQSIMGGRVMESYSEKLFKKGHKSGMEAGRQLGMKAGKELGMKESILKMTCNLLKLKMPYDSIAQATETSVEEVKRIAEKSGLAY